VDPSLTQDDVNPRASATLTRIEKRFTVRGYQLLTYKRNRVAAHSFCLNNDAITNVAKKTKDIGVAGRFNGTYK
jgi:hypothetical protein